MKGRFASNVTFDVQVRNFELGDFDREEWTGLKELEVPLSNALDFEINGTGFIGAEIEIYYTDPELDRSGDGSKGGPGDIDENTLVMFFNNGSSGKWERVTDGLSWVEQVGRNTTDFGSYGTSYSGKISATLGHLSTYVLVGRIIEDDTLLPVMADPGGDRTVYLNELVILDGSGSTGNGWISNYTWNLPQLGLVLYGPLVSMIFNETGMFNVTLSVMDQLGLEGVRMVSFTVIERKVLPIQFTLMVGPIKDEYMKIIKGARIRLSWNGTSFENTTGVDGKAFFLLPEMFLNRTVKLHIEMEGYYSMEYDIQITQDGRIDGDLPLLSVYEPDVTANDDEPSFPLWILIIVCLVILILLVVVAVTIRKKNRASEYIEE